MTLIGATITYFYRFVAINYTKLAKKSNYKFKSEEVHSAACILETPHPRLDKEPGFS